MEKQLNLIYALKENSIVSISDVESGLKCGCICPACGEQLVAKKGKKRTHHFAHYSGKTCSYGYESSLHLAAKDILSKARKMTVPSVYVHFPDSYKKDVLISKAREIEIDSVELEKQFGSIIPDVVVHAGGKTFFIEVYVTHCIDEVKLEKLRESQISTIEIDLSKKTSTISVDELTKILLDDSDEKQWKYNRISEAYLKRFIAVLLFMMRNLFLFKCFRLNAQKRFLLQLRHWPFLNLQNACSIQRDRAQTIHSRRRLIRDLLWTEFCA